MSKKRTSLVALLFLVGTVLTGAVPRVLAQAATVSYPSAAPLSQYFIADKASEIDLARSAAPASISGEAEVLVLAQNGYVTAAKGGNGFVCLVERSWGKDTADPEFWNPRVQAPICVNAAAARTYLPIVLMKTRLAMAGKSKTEIARTLDAALDTKELPPLEPNAMCYMMSSRQYLSDEDMHWRPHLMWFVPGDAVQSWEANLPGVPVIAGHVPEDRMTVFMVGVGRWSDGTPTTTAAH